MSNADLIVSIEVGAALLSVLLGVIYALAIGSARGVHLIRTLSICLTLLFVSAVGWGKFCTHRAATISTKDIEANPAEAIDRLTRALRIDPAYGPLYFKRGVAYSKNNDQQRAYLDLEKAATLSRETLPLAEELAKVATALGYTDEARAFVAEVLAKDPKNFDALNARGIIADRQRRYADAQRDYDAALAVAVDDEERFIAHSNVALPLTFLGRLDEALTHLAAAQKLHPHEAEVLAAIAQTYGLKAERGDGFGYHRLALEMADRALNIDAHHPVAGVTRAVALFYLGNRDEAFKELSEVIRLHPEYPEFQALKSAMENYQKGAKLPEQTFLKGRREGLQR
jgi:tetratricopeptide (TPR) repeat protein